MVKTKRLTKALIEMYFERKCLWQVRSEDYKKRDMKTKAYLEIVAFLRRNGVKDADIKLVRDKIQNLRRAMRKEKKRIDDSGGNYSPTLWYYDLLTFVNDQSEDNSNTRSTGNTNLDDFEDDEYIVDNLEEDHKPSDNVQRTSASTGLEPNKSRLDNLAVRPDEYEALGICVASKVKRMETTQQVYADLLIQKVLARGLLNQLSGTTEIVDLEGT